MEFSEADIAQARRHVAHGRHLVARQWNLVRRMKRSGFDAANAEMLLSTLRAMQQKFEDHLASMEAEL